MGFAYHPRPLCEFRLDMISEILRATGLRDKSDCREPLLHVCSGQQLRDMMVEQLDNAFWRSGGRQDTGPIANFVVADAVFLQSWHVRQSVRTLLVSDGKPAQLSVLDVLSDERQRDVQDPRMAGDVADTADAPPWNGTCTTSRPSASRNRRSQATCGDVPSESQSWQVQLCKPRLRPVFAFSPAVLICLGGILIG
jgi:hypothetical protein